jgi:hypothetical protein
MQPLNRSSQAEDGAGVEAQATQSPVGNIKGEVRPDYTTVTLKERDQDLG